MASGDVLLQFPTTPVAGPQTFGIAGAGQINYKLLDAVDVSGAANGVWCDCREYNTGTVTFAGVATLAILEVDGSNADTQPAAATAGTPLATGTTAGTNGPAVVLASLPRWIKCRVTTVGTGTATVIANLRSTGPN